MGAMALADDIRACRICEARFAATATAHEPRPVPWFLPEARILIASQAPGMRVHKSGLPFSDPSGERLRQWMDVSEDEFYDMRRVAIVPMSFCFPGYNASGSDLPPPPVCARTWRASVMKELTSVRLTLVVGGAAIRWHLKGTNVTDAVLGWREHAGHGVFPLPHPSWRNTAWLRRNPWFEADLLPVLRHRVRAELAG